MNSVEINKCRSSISLGWCAHLFFVYFNLNDFIIQFYLCEIDSTAESMQQEQNKG